MVLEEPLPPFSPSQRLLYLEEKEVLLAAMPLPFYVGEQEVLSLQVQEKNNDREGLNFQDFKRAISNSLKG